MTFASMPLGTDELLMRWSVRLAVGCYLVRMLIDLGFGAERRPKRLARAFWTIGCLLYLIHVFCAFHFIHEWSHFHAYEHTAEVTREVVGWDWGGGLYFNYLLTAVWFADTAAWWRRPAFHERNPICYWGMHGCFAVIVFNATVVFGPVHWRWIGVAVAIALIPLASWRLTRAAGLITR